MEERIQANVHQLLWCFENGSDVPGIVWEKVPSWWDFEKPGALEKLINQVKVLIKNAKLGGEQDGGKQELKGWEQGRCWSKGTKLRP